MSDMKAVEKKDRYLLTVTDACLKYAPMLKDWSFQRVTDSWFSDDVVADFYQNADTGRCAILHLTWRELRLCGQDTEKMHRVVYFKMRIMAELAGIEIAEHEHV